MRTLSLLSVLLPSVLLGCDSGSDEVVVRDLIAYVSGDNLILETVEEFGCSNYPLLVESRSTSSGVSVAVVGVDTDIDVCQRAFGPATAQVRLSVEQPVGYPITVRQGEDEDRLSYSCGIAGCTLDAEGELSFIRLSR